MSAGMMSTTQAAAAADQVLEQLLELAAKADDLDRYGLFLDSDTVCHGDGGSYITADHLSDWLLASLFVRWVRERRAREKRDALILHRRKQFRAIRGGGND